MLYEILKHIRNFFPDEEHQKSGVFVVEGGAIHPFPNLSKGQYVLIEGSALNDGIWNDDLSKLEDETFTGTITPLKIPKEFLNLVAEIESYQANAKPSEYVSESFGGYSYTKARTASGNVASWQSAFGTRLNAWRKI